MVAELYDDKAPITVANFKTYVNEGFYTNLHCYRIIAGFVNQCGGGADGKAGSHPAIHNEASTSGLHNKQYTVAMARLGPECNTGCPDKPDSATTEFYINAADNCFLDPRATSSCASQAVNDAGYAVFGVLVSGHDVSDHLNTMGRQSPAPALQSVTLLA
jgi:cyclophilin family peptidyl-prolyl cis-trans isomerase